MAIVSRIFVARAAFVVPLVAALIILTVWPIGISSSASARTSSTALRIVFTGLAPGTHASAVIRGHDYKRVIHRSGTVRITRAGTYRIYPRRTIETAGVEIASMVSRVSVDLGHTVSTTASFDYLPNSTRALPRSATISISGPVSGTRHLELRNVFGVQPGQILTSNPGPNDKLGYLVKVQSVRTSATIADVVVVPATIFEAIPDGSIDIASTLNDLDQRLGSTPSLTPSLNSSTSESSCDGSAGISLQGRIHFSVPNADAGILGWHGVPDGTFIELNLNAEATLGVLASAKASCQGTITLLDVVGPPIDVGPVELTPTLDITANGAVSVQGAINDSTSIVAVTSVEADTRSTPKVTVQLIPFSPTLTSNFQANASITLLANIGVEAYGVLDGSIDIGPKFLLNVTPSETPWWDLQGCLVGGFKAGLAGHTIFNESQILNIKCVQLASSSTLPVATTTTTLPGSPVTTTTTTTAPLPPPLPSYLQSVTFGDGRFVALGVPGSKTDTTDDAAYSTNGVDWYPTKLPAQRDWTDITYGKGYFVAISDHGRASTARALVAYSTNGVTWKTSTLPTKTLSYSEVAYGAGRFVAMANKTNADAYTTNPARWSYTTTLPLAAWSGLAYGSGKFVAISQTTSGKGVIAAYSTNGATWNRAVMPFGSPSVGQPSWQSITYGNGEFVAVGGYAPQDAVAYSANGAIWTAANLSGNGWWDAIGYGTDGFVAVGQNGGSGSISTNATTWAGTQLPGDNTSWNSVAYGNGVYVAVQVGPSGFLGQSFGAVAYSSNGTTWTPTASVNAS